MSNKHKITEDGNEIHVEVDDTQPITEAYLRSRFGLMPDIWEIQGFRGNSWDAQTKEGEKRMFSGRATFLRKVPVVCDWPVIAPVKMSRPIKFPDRKTDAAIKKAIVIGDAQVGFKRNMDTHKVETLHDMRAFACVTAAIKAVKPDVLVMLGDMLDLPDWSDHFIQTPETALSTQMSINWLAAWIYSVRRYAGAAVYLEGNHEKRIVRAIITNTASAHRLKPANLPESPPLLSVESMLRLPELGVEYIGEYPRGEYWLNENFSIIHGNIVGARSGQTVMKMLDSPRSTVMQGHVHRMESAHVTAHSIGKSVTYGAHSIGTLARIDGVVPSNAAKENWQNGFAVVEYTDKLFQVHQINIFGGKMILNGKLYSHADEPNVLDHGAAESLLQREQSDYDAAVKRGGHDA